METTTKIYVVTSDDVVMGTFSTRKFAVRFIIDELSLALQFTEYTEGEELEEYLMHNDTPSKEYEYNYRITETTLNA